MIAPGGVGPPGPEMGSPSGKLGRREVSIERATTGTYPATAQLSSASRGWFATLSARRSFSRSGWHVGISHRERRPHAANRRQYQVGPDR